MEMNDMVLISVDDHIVEPPDLFEARAGSALGWPREEATVGALRAKAAHVDLGYTDTRGAGRPPMERSAGHVTFADVTKQLSQQSIPMNR